MELYNQSLELKRRVGDQSAIGSTLNNLAIVHSKKGEDEQALKLYKELGDIERDRRPVYDCKHFEFHMIANKPSHRVLYVKQLMILFKPELTD